MTEHSQNLQSFWHWAWQRLARGAHDRAAPTRFVMLATQDQTGWADARMLVLRAAMAESAQITLHTDAQSPKIADLRTDPRCCLLAWDAEAQLQIRLRARARLSQGSAAEWSALPDAGRALYGGCPAPGTSLPAPEAHEIAPDPARFTCITLTGEALDLLHLDPAGHRRARYLRSAGWAGEWIAP